MLNLAWLLKDTNRLAEAESLMQPALNIYEESFGPEHPSTVTARTGLERIVRLRGPEGAPTVP